MATIPASQFVNVLPNVLSAGGNALNMVGLMLTNSWRVPIGSVASFPNSATVATAFGSASNEASQAAIYFQAPLNATQQPGNMLIAQYPSVAVGAWLQSGNIAGAMTLAQLQTLSGTLTVNIDGYARTAGALSLSGATSFSSAAALIASGLNASLPTAASVTGAIAAGSASFTGVIAGDVLTVSGSVTGTIVPGCAISGTGVTAGTTVTSQLSGTAGAAGTYAVSVTQTVASTTISATYGVMTVSAVSSGTLSIGQGVSGSGVTAGTIITALGTGTGLTGTYYVNKTQTAASTAITAAAVAVTVSFDSVSNAFVINSGITGPASTATYATGTLAASLLMTLVTGAQISQGAAETDPVTFMMALSAQFQNWATFWTNFDPDFGSGNAQKVLFAKWTNSTNNRYAYICWDTDTSPTVSAPATGCTGYLIGTNGANYSGTILVYEPSELYHAAFVAGWAASIDFNAINGRSTLDYKSQTGLAAAVTSASVLSNLQANGYSAYAAVATAAQNFLFMDNGQISGQFLWADSYINQIWLNNALQQALMNLLTSVKSIPYTSSGYALIRAACQDPINAGLTFGAIRPNVNISQSQIAQVNNAAGAQVVPTLIAQGWFLSIQDATSQVRAARKSPPITLWYLDGQSVQRIVLNSVEVQ
jgi:hypothetical protein